MANMFLAGLAPARGAMGVRPAEAGDGIGVVLLHGKGGSPNFAVNDLGDRLAEAGFIVSVPEMPWSRRRYLDTAFPAALGLIAGEVAALKARGASRVVVAGHSMGANAALAYAADRGGLAGVILLAAGHTPDLPDLREAYAESLDRARSMIAEGRGGEEAVFRDVNQGRPYDMRMRADIYASYFSPDGLADMPDNAARLSPDIPMLYVIGDQDRLYHKGSAYIFDKAPPNPGSRYLVVRADHMTTPAAAADAVSRWLRDL